jgi:hypothetical protein
MIENKLREVLRQAFLTSSQTYCCYCGEEQTSIGCCSENHFETFSDMDKRTQEEFLDGEMP